ncbi:GNAT family N-acetyltransferase [Streptomyces daliensis]|uniref:GNAT family N-acetyltransferase n=1 Tax=Streptomyces daliensis TaxID=299421 RepID=A0A8T4J434_9ACTN|nr:GNAT family N-acetyltransferase [Streptomyces daliensis]
MAADDSAAVAELTVRGWQHAYAGLMPQGYLDAMSAEESAVRRREIFAATLGRVSNLVAEDAAGTVTGWAAVGPYRQGTGAGATAADDDAELYAVYVRPELIGTGTGRALMDAALERARARGFRRMLLWVVTGNARARRFYERAGFTADGAESTYEVDGTPVPEIRYGRAL